MKRFFVLGGTALLAMSASAFAQRMIACDSSRVLYDVDIESGAKTQFGTISANAGTTGGLAYDEVNDIMYLTSTSLDSLFTLDITTGEATLVGAYGGSEFVMHGLEFDSSTGILYGVSQHNNGLYNIDKTTGAATLIGTSGLGSFSNLGYDSDNDIMYSTNSGADSFYIMDRNTGGVTLVGPLVSSTNPNALAYNRENGVLYMADNSTDNFHKMDVNTGEALIIGSMGSGNILGLAYIPGSPPGPTIRVSGTCPGTVTVSWSEITPRSTMGIVFASNTGNLIIPGGPCQGTELGLGAANIRLVNTINSGSGSGSVNGNAGTGACGGYLQIVVVDGNPCSTTNVAQIP